MSFSNSDLEKKLIEKKAPKMYQKNGSFKLETIALLSPNNYRLKNFGQIQTQKP